MPKIFEIRINSKDILWSYLASLFSFSSSLLILPFILDYLSPDELGINYLMNAFSGFVLLIDFGFAVQFSRSFTYLFSGAQSIQKIGLSQNSDYSGEINYKLVYTLIESSKYVYRRISLIALFFMSTIGSFYIYKITNNYSTINNIFLIWLIFSISLFFNIYFSFYEGLLKGKGMIKELNQIVVFSRVVQIGLTLLLLRFEFGLLGVVLANFIYPFLSRFLMVKLFYTKDIKELFSNLFVNKSDLLEVINLIWYNSKKLGAVFVGSFLINKISFIVAGYYLPLKDIASYGLMEQLFSVVVSISLIYFNTHIPMFSYFRVNNNTKELLNTFALSVAIFSFLFLIGTSFVILFSNSLIHFINSDVSIPPVFILILYSCILFLEQNHSLFASFLVTKNVVPFVYPSLISGVVILVISSLLFSFYCKNIIVVILVPGIIQLLYNNWKWPKVVLDDFNISFINFYKIVVLNFYFFLKRTVSLVKPIV